MTSSSDSAGEAEPSTPLRSTSRNLGVEVEAHDLCVVYVSEP